MTPPNVSDLLPALCEFLLKSALVLAAALLVNRAWAHASAAQRHLVWCAAFCTLLLLPLTRFVVPRWAMPLQRVRVELPQPDRPEALPPVEVAARAEPAFAPALPAPRWRWPDWKQVAIYGWAVGVGVLLGGRLAGSLRLALLRRRMPLLEEARVRKLAAEMLGELGIRRNVELRLAPEGCVPLTWGSLRPVLLLPAEALQWSDVRLAAALRHEAGHIARFDHLARWCAQLACVFYWPNPLVWIAARRLHAAQEEAADDLVLRAGTAPGEYTEQLFDVARSLVARRSLAPQAVAMATPSTLERRMLAIVDPHRDRRPLSARAMLGGGLAVVLTLVISAAAQLQAEERKAGGESAAKAAEEILVETKFVELSGPAKEILAARFPGMFSAPFGTPSQVATLSGVWSATEFAEVSRALGEEREAKVLSAPRLTTRSGQRAMIEIVRDFRYASEYEKEGEGWKPKQFETRQVGVSFDITPVIGADGYTLDLDFRPSLVRLLGWNDVDTGRKYFFDGGDPLFGAAFDEPKDLPAGHRFQPEFSTLKVTTTAVSIFDGQTVMLTVSGVPPEKGQPASEPPRELLIFVTARRLFGTAPATLSPIPPEATHSIPLAPSARMPFPPGDSIELLELRGSAPQLKVGGTYWLRGRYNLDSHVQALLYAGCTSVSKEPVIAPAAGGVHEVTIRKGRGDFAFAFKLLGSGTVHVSLNDPENKDPMNNAFAGWSLGTAGQ